MQLILFLFISGAVLLSTDGSHCATNCGKGCGDHSTVAGDMKYLGCFQYYHNPQRLAGPWHTESIRNTVDRCIDFCLLGNLKYAGAQNGTNCICGNEIIPRVKIDECRCQMECRGNSTQRCGGEWALSVYETGA